VNQLTDLHSGVSTMLAALAIMAAVGAIAVATWHAVTSRDQPPPDTHADLSEADLAELVARPHVRAGSLRTHGPDRLSRLAPLPPSQQAAIGRMARAIAVHDFRSECRPRPNPYRANSRAHAVYAIEYSATWSELEAQTESRA
jgi:hypothetical protein